MAATAQPTLESAHTGQKSVVVARTPAGVKMRPVVSLVAYERDPRTHSAGAEELVTRLAIFEDQCFSGARLQRP